MIGPVDAALVDVDGTLVDSNYHHTVAWHRAFQECGKSVPAWQIHRHIGMGGDRLVPAVAGDDFEERSGDDVRAAWRTYADEFLVRIAPFANAVAFLEGLAARGLKVVLASSGPAEHVEHYVDLLAARSVIDAWTTSADVDDTKPAPELLQVAMDRVDSRDALVVGDSTWDFVAARRLGLPSIGLLCGGFCADELMQAGASAVVADPGELTDRLESFLTTSP